MQHRTIPIVLVALFAACVSDDPEETTSTAAAAREAAPSSAVATALGSGDASLPRAEIEGGRRDDAWRRFLAADTSRDAARGDAAGDSAASVAGAGRTPRGDSASAGAHTGRAESGDTASESWDDISPETLNAGEPALPLSGDREGPSVVRIQVLLDRTDFSPGIIDGYWGKNTEKAVYWLQSANDLPATGAVDARTYDRIVALAGAGEIARRHTLTAQDVEGPFVSLPEDVYERAQQECLCYESLTEKLAEMFHTSPELLAQLNPDVDLSALAAGDALNVPDVGEPFLANAQPNRNAGAGRIAKIVVSDGGHYVHAVDASGNVLYHFPSTLGSEYAPSPTGDYHVSAIAFDPTWHYQPDLLTGEPDEKDDAVLPAGPNNAVGVVWLDLSKEHYGIHGTSAPETIGYATSHGCVRLTNWDARFLAERIEAGVPVEFRDAARGSADGAR
jgi:lipoprotein-anchoring transpeptidase ErfK/SrfK